MRPSSISSSTSPRLRHAVLAHRRRPEPTPPVRALGASLVLQFLVLASPSAAEQLRVGSDTFCDFNSLEAALSSAGEGDVLYVEAKTWTAPSGGFQIDGVGLDVIGVQSCADTDPGTATLEGDGTGSVVEIDGVGTSVSLTRIDVTGGGADADHGGGLEVRGEVDLTLSDLSVFGNTSGLGGGVYFEGVTGASLTLRDDAGLQTNVADSGGGLYCTGPVVVSFASGSISVNEADDGGGVWLGAGCFMNVETGGAFRGITFNDAVGSGGGAWVEGGAELRLGRGAGLTANEAATGGGVFLTGADTMLNGENAQIANNAATGPGGGIYAENLAEVRLVGSPRQPGCRETVPRCSLLNENSAGSGASGNGGGMYLGTGVFALVERTFVEDNQAEEGSAFYAADQARLIVRGSMIVGNSGATEVVAAIEATTLALEHVTFADNLDHAVVIDAFGTPTFSLLNSIVWDDTGAVLGTGISGTASVVCVRVHESGSLPAGATFLKGDPAFVDPGGGDYHLAAGSPSIDRCAPLGGLLDIDGEATGFDDPGTFNLGEGVADVGADEWSPGVVFADGFESGSTSAWQ